MRPLMVIAFLPLVVLAMVFDLICVLSVLGWIVLLFRDGTVTDDVLAMLKGVLR